jgi:hypothetical protein
LDESIDLDQFLLSDEVARLLEFVVLQEVLLCFEQDVHHVPLDGYDVLDCFGKAVEEGFIGT